MSSPPPAAQGTGPAAAPETEAKLAALGGTLDWATNVAHASERIRAVKESGGGLMVLTGAGMSVSSGVPVFRSADGTMSPDFLGFLGDYNAARKAAGLREAADWFDFSVPGMFRKETEKEAWAYWRWRILRARVAPAPDYAHLMRIAAYFGPANVFVTTSNCDLLHVAAGVPKDKVLEIHGSLGRVQCSAYCTDTMWDVDDTFVARLAAEPAWVPRCTACGRACLRPNVMIFSDDMLVGTELEQQEDNSEAFLARFEPAAGTAATTTATATATASGAAATSNLVVLEIGAGTVVPSIRTTAEGLGATAAALVRVNPSASECADLQTSTLWLALSGAAQGAGAGDADTRYFPLVGTSSSALAAIADTLSL